ncbi:MAG TPA: hypothetical protein VMV77_16505 [Bacteroidales bacterium]|nr:hypothetical protein [Bacteroidales bacterium]
MRKVIFLVIISTLSFLSCTSLTDKGIFKSNWNSTGSRTWIGPEYWTNPLQDWQVDKGRLCCQGKGKFFPSESICERAL